MAEYTDEVAKLLKKKPLMGIELGCQILAVALGARVFKMKYGHRGGNHSVKNIKTGDVEAVVQNHGSGIDADSLKGKGEVSHINLNDKSVEGVDFPKYHSFGVQYYPMARPGAHDASFVFKKFILYMEKFGEVR